ncbi:MAG: ABC transporter permease [Methanospirillum sp.]|uniref:ABC transporter permease n=1 Tax=Methanospirillum sp. TaxID=45200 RepID=UPI00236BA6A1|nr:ABC transporter permease [Methanospirillum sp.]MDD1729523.1 ABC transporter permease [Methanospirillum sp.]
MDLKVFVRGILVITEKNMRIYYFKGPVMIFGLLFPLIMFLTFFIGRNLDLIAFFPGFLGMMLFFTASSVGPLITPWEKREKTYERLVSLPVILESIIIGDLLAGALFGVGITTLVFIICAALLHLPVLQPGLLALAVLVGSITFAALGTFLASPTTNNPSNIMMLSSLVRLPLMFISGIFIPLNQLEGPVFILTSLSPLTYLVDLFHASLNGDAVYPPWVDLLVLLVVILALIKGTKCIQRRNLVKGV